MSARFLSLSLLALLCAVLAGCQTYRPAPVAWEDERRRWEDTASTNVLELTLAEATRLALVANGDLNTLRLRRASSEKVRRATGWWDDPSLSVDALSVLRDRVNPLAWSGALAVTVPLSGIPGLQKEAAQYYTEAEGWAVRAAELELAARVAAAAERDAILRGFVVRRAARLAQDDYVRALDAVESLAANGELSRPEAIRLAAENRQQRDASLAFACESEQAAADVVRLLGLAPGTRIRWRDLPAPSALRCPDPAPLDLASHPLVQEKRARLGESETALNIEIRRQYPQLTIGPSTALEEGKYRVGLAAGLSLPLWNRNQQGIAEAEGRRDVSRADAVNTWRALVADWDTNRRLLAVRGADDSAAVSAAAADRALAAAAGLYRRGELDAAGYIAQTHAALAAEESALRRASDYARLAAETIRFQTELK